MECHICQNPSIAIHRLTLLDKHRTTYYKCTRCKFIQTDDPHWLGEAYSKAIAATDIGLVSRNLHLSKIFHAIITGVFNPSGRFIDYGGGYGLLVRLMRDRGFRFYHYDRHCENLLSHHFPAKMDTGKKYDVLTAVEVFEHLPNPMDEIKKMLSYSDNILFTTMLTPSDANPPEDWWYYAPETGQHISFYAMDSLRAIARHFNLTLFSNRKNIHLLTTKPTGNIRFKLFSNPLIAYPLSLLYRRRSLRDDDYRYALKSSSQ